MSTDDTTPPIIDLTRGDEPRGDQQHRRRDDEAHDRDAGVAVRVARRVEELLATVERARAAGVAVSYTRAAGLWHAYPVLVGMLAEADDAVAGLGAAHAGVVHAADTPLHELAVADGAVWVRRGDGRWADVADGNRPGPPVADAAELREARKRIRLLEQENEVLRRAAAYLSQANLPGK